MTCQCSKNWRRERRSRTWSTAREVAGKLNGGGDGSVSSVSCRAAGYCTAGGYYLTGFTKGKYQAYVVSETKGVWGGAGQVPGTGALNAGGEADNVVVSCASAGNCAVAGDYEDKSHHTQAFIAGSAGGRWAVAEAIPGSVGLNKGGDASPTSVSCASATSCAVGGFYSATASFALGFVASGALPQTSRSALTLGGCTLSAKRLAVGKHSLAASYGGSVGYSGSGSAAKVVTVVR